MIEELASAEQLADRIVSSPRAVLFLDTAAFFDVLRAAYRDSVPTSVVAAAADLVRLATLAPPEIWVTTTGIVGRELIQNRKGSIRELRVQVLAVESALGKLSQIAGIVMPESPITSSISSEIAERLIGIVDDLIAACFQFRGPDSCSVRAANRLIDRRHPSPRPGNQQFKDCLIFEEFLELAVCLRARGLSSAIVLVTPNKDDYGHPKHGPIARELEALDASYVLDVAWALTLVTRNSSSAP